MESSRTIKGRNKMTSDSTRTSICKKIIKFEGKRKKKREGKEKKEGMKDEQILYV